MKTISTDKMWCRRLLAAALAVLGGCATGPSQPGALSPCPDSLAARQRALFEEEPPSSNAGSLRYATADGDANQGLVQAYLASHFANASANADDANGPLAEDAPREPSTRLVLAINAAVFVAIMAFGALAWDYGSASFSFENEGWFEHDTGYGGADKLGHAWVTYVASVLYTNLYKHLGFEHDRAALYGTLSSLAQMTLVEIGDGFSGDHGFSWEDAVANAVGAGFGYLRMMNPRLRDTVDFRLEWIPSKQFRRGHRWDAFTDYSGQKYVLALKPAGLIESENPWLRMFEFHLGYYTRGYVSLDEEFGYTRPRRFGYAGIGLNMTNLLEQTVNHRLWNLFDYVQAPYTYLPLRHAFD